MPLQCKQLPAGQDLMAALEEEARTLLDPSQESGVLRATLLEPAANGEQEAVLALTLHAVAGEEPSMQLLQSQVLAAYEGAKSGDTGGIAPGLQFRDVLHWLSERQSKGVHIKSLQLHVMCWVVDQVASLPAEPLALAHHLASVSTCSTSHTAPHLTLCKHLGACTMSTQMVICVWFCAIQGFMSHALFFSSPPKRLLHYNQAITCTCV